MSAGDYLRFLRAVKGGPTPWEVETATGVAAGDYRQIEQRYRSFGDEQDLTRLAPYFGVAPEDLIERHGWSRKDFSATLVEVQEADREIRFQLRNGEAIEGKVAWSDLGAAMLTLKDGQQIVIQRHFVDRWELL